MNQPLQVTRRKKKKRSLKKERDRSSSEEGWHRCLGHKREGGGILGQKRGKKRQRSVGKKKSHSLRLESAKVSL